MLKHSTGKGSKYVGARLPFQKLLEIKVNSKSDALKMEYQIKKLSKKNKEELIISYSESKVK